MIDMSKFKNFDAQTTMNDIREHARKVEGTKNLPEAQRKTWDDYYETLDKENSEWIKRFIQTTDLSTASVDDLARTQEKGAKAAKDHNTSLKNMTIGAKVGNVALKGLAMAGNALATAAISAGIEALANGIEKTVNYEENMNKASSQMADNIKSTTSTLDSYKDKIESLRATMFDSSSTIEEVTSARQELLSIQNELIDKYGSEAEGVDLLNGSLEDQLKILEEIGAKSFKEQKDEYNKKDLGDHVSDFFTGNIGVSKFDQMKNKFENYDMTLAYASVPKEIEKYAESIGFEKTMDEYGVAALQFQGDAEGAAQAAELLRNKVDDLKRTDPGNAERYDKWAKSVESTLTKAKDFYSDNKDAYDSNTFYEEVLDSPTLKKFYQDLTDAQDKYQDALTSGDEAAMKESLSNYKKYYDQIDSVATSDATKRYFSNMFDSTNTAMKQMNFDNDVDSKASSILSDLKKIKTAYGDLTEEQMKSTDEVQKLAKQYGVSSDYIVSKLKDVGIIQSDQYKELYSRFGEKLKTLSKDQLEIAYKIENVGDMTFEQMKAKILETQAIASNEIDINARTNLDAYNTAKEGSSTSDDYDSYVAMMNSAKELAKAGKIGTEEFKKAAIAFSENGMDDIDDWNENLAYLGKYFTEDSSGAKEFVKTLQGLEYPDGTPFAKLRDDGEGFDLNLKDMQYMAEQLHMPLEMVSVLLQNLQSYGFTDSYFGTMEEGLDKLSSKSLELAQAKAKLATMDPNQGTEYEAQQEKVKSLTEQVNNLKQGIDDLRNSEEKQPKDTGAIEGAQALIDQYKGATTDDEKSAIKSAMSQYEGEYNVKFVFTADGNVTVARSIEEIESDIDKAQSKLNELSQNNGGKLDMDDSEVQDAVAKMQNLLAEKQAAEEPAIMQLDSSNLDGEIADAVQKIQRVQEIINQIEQAKIVPGADTSQLESELSSAIADVKNLSPDVTAKLNINTDEVQAEANTVQAKITAHASIDENDLSTIKTTVAAVDPQLAIDASDEKANAKLDDMIAKINSSTGQIQVDADLTNAKNTVANWKPDPKYSTVTYTIQTIGSVPVGGIVKKAGKGGANGTFHGYAKGTNVSLRHNETALVNEIGNEGLLRNGILYEIPGNAHTMNLRKGDILFNDAQMKELKEHGYVTSNGGRGKLIGNGFAEGTLNGLPELMRGFYGGSGGAFYDGGSSSSSSSKKKKSTSSSSRKSSSGSSSSSSSSNSSSSNSSSDSSDDYEEIKDWVEVYLSRQERITNNLIDAIDRQVGLLNKQTATNKAIAQVQKEITAQQKSANRYKQQADSVDLSESYKSQVRDGTLDIETITDEDLKKKIDDYQEWYEKYLDCIDAVDELKDKLTDLAQTKFDNVTTEFENQISLIEHEKNLLNSSIDLIESKGYLVSQKLYNSLLDQESQNLEKLKSEYNTLVDTRDQLVKGGLIKKYSDEWYDMTSSINDVSEAILESKQSTVEFQNAIRQLKWDIFNKTQDMMGEIQTESDFLIDLMSNDKMYDTDTAKITDKGQATMGLHTVNYNAYMRQADEYYKELQNIQKQLANDPYNQDLKERYDELLEKQRDMIKSAEDEKQSIIDLTKDGYDAFMDVMDRIIEKRQKFMDQQKDLYDYEKDIADQTKEISQLQKQLDSYSGDTSEESQATIQQLKTSLADAQQNLQDSEYERYISDQNDLYDDLKDTAQEYFDAKIDQVNEVINQAIIATNTNAADIKNTLTTEAGNVGTTLSNAMNAIWSTDGTFTNVVTQYQTNFSGLLTTTNNVLNSILNYIANMVKDSDKKAETQVKENNSIKSTPSKTPTPAPTPKPATKPKNNTSSKWGSWFIKKKDYYPKSKLNVNESIVDRLKYFDFDSSWGARAKYYKAMGKSDTYQSSASQNVWMIKEMKKHSFKQGGTIGNLIKQTGEDGFILARTGEEVLSLDKIKELQNAFTSMDSLVKNLIKVPQSDYAKNSGTVNNDIVLNLTLPNVQNVDDFVTELRNNKRFEKVVQQMTLGSMIGNNSLSKFKI